MDWHEPYLSGDKRFWNEYPSRSDHWTIVMQLHGGDLVEATMGLRKEEKIKKQLKELRRNAKQERKKEEKEQEPNQDQVREAFRKNMGCGG